MSPRCARTRDTWRTRRAPDEPALHPHARHVAHPQGTRQARAAPAREAHGAPAGLSASPRCARTWDAWRTRRAPDEPARHPHPGRVAHPEGTR